MYEKQLPSVRKVINLLYLPYWKIKAGVKLSILYQETVKQWSFLGTSQAVLQNLMKLLGL